MIPDYASIDRSKLSYKHAFMELYWHYAESGFPIFKAQFNPSLPPSFNSSLSRHQLQQLGEKKKMLHQDLTS